MLRPQVHPTVFIAEGARVYGDVQVSAGASIWFNAVLRGDEGRIVIGPETNVQDNVVIHSDLNFEVHIGRKVSIGHGAVIRGCRIEDNVMIGMNSTIMTSAVIGENSIVGANAMISYNKQFPPRSLIMGVPAKRVRKLTERELGMNEIAISIYQSLVEKYSKGQINGI